MRRSIVGYRQDEASAWVAELSCGHGQHVRHDPPWQSRPWVVTEQGRAQHLGTELDCPSCEMATLPAGLTAYKQTPSFTEATLPSALRAEHQTKPGVWAQIVMEEGKLEYTCARGTFVLQPGVLGVVEPASVHSVRPLQTVRFYVLFMRTESGEAHG
ncbi:MAG: hypothetical protein RLZZ450_3509 [Pseudomonadota bacterium]